MKVRACVCACVCARVCVFAPVRKPTWLHSVMHVDKLPLHWIIGVLILVDFKKQI